MAELLAVLVRSFHRDLYDGALEAAEATVARMEAEAPAAVETRGCRLELLMRTRRTQEAAALLASLLDQFPGSARIHLLAGKHRYGAREYQAALRSFRESERLTPSSATRRWIGKTLTQLGAFDEAEAVLGRLEEEGQRVLLERAWLAERRDDLEQALRLIDMHLAQSPGDRFAEQQRARVEGKRLTPEQMVEDVDQLRALGEPVPAEIIPDYVRNLLRAGRTEDVVRLLAEIDPMTPKLAGQVAWACYHLAAYDLAFDLFSRGLSVNTTYVKYMRAFEKTARMCDRIDALIEVYEEAASTEPKFYGRITRLRRQARRGSSTTRGGSLD